MEKYLESLLSYFLERKRSTWILNNKTKTIIERIIYIDKNKNKFIKFNKNYEPLSNFKYNRKNKYFYM